MSKNFTTNVNSKEIVTLANPYISTLVMMDLPINSGFNV